MLQYEFMRQVLDERIPETLHTVRYAEMIDFWGDEEIPIYCYYETIEKLFIDLLNGDNKDKKLLERVLDFMEDMANSEDTAVQNLMQVQILEGLFGLDYDVFTRMERELLRPSTLALFQQTKTWFNCPKPPNEKT